MPSDFDLYLSTSKLRTRDPEKPLMTEWLYTVPQAILTKFNDHLKWVVTCDYISLASNISTVDKCTIACFNSESQKKYVSFFNPSVETSVYDFETTLKSILQSPQISEVCGALPTAKIWSFEFNKATKRFEIGKSTSRPPQEYVDSIYILMSKRLGEKIGFSDKLTIQYSDIPVAGKISGTEIPDTMKYMRRLYLTGDFLERSFLNSTIHGMLTSFDFPKFFNTRSSVMDYGFFDNVEIDRSMFNHWVPIIDTNAPVWCFSLINELGEVLKVVDSHHMYIRLRFRPAPIED